MEKEIYSEFDYVKGLAPIVVSDNTAQVSAILDCAQYDAVEVVVQTGVIADADVTFTATFEEGDDSGLSDAAAVAAADIVGSVPSLTFASDGLVKTFGYKGAKRYIRLTITPANNTGSAPLAVLFVGHKVKVGSTL